MKFKIVYLDDEPELAEVFSEMFSTDKIEVHAFVDPMQALAFITKEGPNLIFLDYHMPHTNGDYLATAIGKKIPIVLVTGALDVKTKFEFSSVLRKPYNRTEVQAIIAKFNVQT